LVAAAVDQLSHVIGRSTRQIADPSARVGAEKHRLAGCEIVCANVDLVVAHRRCRRLARGPRFVDGDRAPVVRELE